jgi:hypothetical protein
MKDKLKKLAEPFADSEIEWRVGSTTKDKKKAMMLPYVTNRAIMNRLDDVLGSENWKSEFREIHKGIICTLSIRLTENGEWITKEDGADLTNIEPTKGGLSDSMKRAAVHFGMGRYLYEAETEWVELNDAGYPKNKPAKVRFTARKEPTIERTLDEALKHVSQSTDIDDLAKRYRELSATMQKDNEVVALKDELKIKFSK